MHVTAFIVGNWLDANPDMAARIADGGHEFANHTYTHPTFVALSPDAMLDEIVALSRRPGPAHRRPGDVLPSVRHRRRHRRARSAGARRRRARPGTRTVLGFDVDPLDYDDPGADAVVQRTLATVAAGSIVSLHFGHSGTVDAMPAILDGIAAEGPEAGARLAALLG